MEHYGLIDESKQCFLFLVGPPSDSSWRNFYNTMHLDVSRGDNTCTDNLEFKEVASSQKTIYINIVVERKAIDLNIFAANLDCLYDVATTFAWKHAIMNGTALLHSSFMNPFNYLSPTMMPSKLLLFDEIASQPKETHNTCVQIGDKKTKFKFIHA